MLHACWLASYFLSENDDAVGLVFVDDPLNQTNPSVEGISPGIDPVHDQFITRHSLVKYCDHVGDNTFRSGERVNIHASAPLHYSSVGSYASVHLHPRSCLSTNGTCELNRDRVGAVLGPDDLNIWVISLVSYRLAKSGI